MELIRLAFGVGKVYLHGNIAAYYGVHSLKDLDAIIEHFDKYPLLTKKRADYELFKRTVELMRCKEHLTLSGLRKIVALKASINNGLSKELKAAFKKITPVLRPKVELPQSIDPYWLSGFVSGDGNFYVMCPKIGCKGPTHLRFRIIQHDRDRELLRSLMGYLGCGRYEEDFGCYTGNFAVTKFFDIMYIIIPFFDKYLLEGVKVDDFEDFKKVAFIMLNRGHVTEMGLEQIRKIKAGMNKGRDWIKYTTEAVSGNK